MKLLGIFMAVAMLVSCPIKAANSSHLVLSERNTVVMSGEFTSLSVAKVQNELISKSFKLDANEEITLVIDSPGGSVSAGLMLINTAKSIPQKVNTLTIFAASMGFQTVQGLGDRYILESGVLMSHRAALSGLGGQLDGELESRLNFYKEFTNILDIQSSDRIGVSLAEYKYSIINELWSTGNVAVSKNHADAVVTASCDESLMGTRIERVMTMFGPFRVKFSNCPLINGPIDIIQGNLVNFNKYLESITLVNKIKNVKTGF